jgi:hypothetical protein
MRITSSGNVGIGTTTFNNYWSGYAVLKLGADNGFFSNIASSTGSALFIAQNVYNDGSIYRHVRTNESGLIDMRDGKFSFLTSPSGSAGAAATMTNRFTILEGGNVGIGTTSPVVKFQAVQTTADWVGGFKNYAANAFGLRVDLSGSSGTNAAFQAYTATGTGVIIQNNGQVGIGTFLPSAKLDVRGQAQFRGSNLGVTIDPTSTGANMYFYESGSPKIYLQSAGPSIFLMDIGIGVTSPQSKLQVAGGIQMADDTDTASATKVGTMRYRTGTDEPVPVTGIDFITNGGFATDTDWTKSSNVSISGGQAIFTANSAAQYIIQGSLWPANSLSGQKVQLTYTVISNSLNAGDFRIGGYTGASAFTLTGLPTTVGTHSVTLDVRTSVGDDNAIDLYVTSAATSGVFVIDNVALIEVTEEDASYADMCMQTGSSTYEWVNIVRNTY